MSRQNETVTLRITLRYRNLDEFVVRYAENVSSAGLFIRTRAPKPAGTRVRFELLLADGERALRGEGVVVTARNDDKPGMSLRFQALEPGSERLVDRIVEAHGQGKLAPTPLSTSFDGDQDKGRRSFQTSWGSGMRGTSGGPAGWRTPPGAGGWVPLGGRGALGSRGGTPTTSGLLPRRPSAKFGPGSPSLPPPTTPNPPADPAPPTLPRRRSSDPRPWATGDLPPRSVPPPVAPADATAETEPTEQAATLEPSAAVAAAAEGEPGAQTAVQTAPAAEPDAAATGPADSSLDGSLPVTEAADTATGQPRTEAAASASMDEAHEPPVLTVRTDSSEPLGSGDIPEAPAPNEAEPAQAEDVEPMQAEADHEPAEDQPASTEDVEPMQAEAQPAQAEDVEPMQAEHEPAEDVEPTQAEAEHEPAEDVEPMQAEAQPANAEDVEPMQAEAQPEPAEDVEPTQAEAMPERAEDAAPTQAEAGPANAEEEPAHAEAVEPMQAEAQPPEAEAAEPARDEAIEPMQSEAEAEDVEPVRTGAAPPPEAEPMKVGSAAALESAAEHDPVVPTSEAVDAPAADEEASDDAVSPSSSAEPKPSSSDPDGGIDGGRPAIPPELERAATAAVTAAPEAAVLAASTDEAVSVEADDALSPAPTEGPAESTLSSDSAEAEAGPNEAEAGPDEAEVSIGRGVEEVDESPVDVDGASSAEAIEAKTGHEDDRPFDVVTSAPGEAAVEPVSTRGATDEAPPSSDEGHADPEPSPTEAAGPGDRDGSPDEESRDEAEQGVETARGRSRPGAPQDEAPQNEAQPTALAASSSDEDHDGPEAEDARGEDERPAAEPALAASAVGPDPTGAAAGSVDPRAEAEPKPAASVEGATEGAAASTDLPDKDSDSVTVVEGTEIRLESDHDEDSASAGGDQVELADDGSGRIEEAPEAPTVGAATDDAEPAAELGPPEASPASARGTYPDANAEQGRSESSPAAIGSDPIGPDATQPSNGAPEHDADPAGRPGEAPALAASARPDEVEVEPAIRADGEPTEVPDSSSGSPRVAPPMDPADQVEVEDEPINLFQVVPPSLLDTETGAAARETSSARIQRSSGPLRGQVEVRGLTAEQAAQIASGERTVVRLSRSAGGARADGSPRGARPSTSRVDAEAVERARPAGPRRPLGLDLGLHYARLGYLESGELKLIPLRGSPYLASWVAATPDGQLVVGSEAGAIARRHPERAIAPLALLEALPTVGAEATASTISLIQGDSDRVMVELGDRRFDVADVLIAFLRVIRAAYIEHFGHDHVRLMVSVPAKFDDLSAGFLRSACREAEIESFRLEPEPDALLRAYHLSDQAVDIAVTVDVGLSRLRVALSRRGTAGLRVIAFTEDASGSARRLDEKIADLALEALNEATGEDYRGDDEVRASTIAAVEIARPELRRAAHLDLKVDVPTRGEEEDEMPFRRVRISRAHIEELTDEIVADMCRVVQGLLRNEGIGPHEVGAVVLAGSAGGFPPLVESLGHLVGREPLISVPPVQALLLGLARGGAALEKKEIVAQPNALASSVGLELPGGRFRPLVHAGTPLPARLARQFPTTRENQTEIVFHLHQGDAEVVRLCTPLGELRLTGLAKRPRGALTAALTLEIDVDGVVKATLREAESKKVGRLEVATQQTPPARRRAIASKPAEADAPPSQKKGFFRKLFGG